MPRALKSSLDAWAASPGPSLHLDFEGAMPALMNSLSGAEHLHAYGTFQRLSRDCLKAYRSASLTILTPWLLRLDWQDARAHTLHLGSVLWGT